MIGQCGGSILRVSISFWICGFFQHGILIFFVVNSYSLRFRLCLKIDLGMHLEQISVALVIKVAAGSEGEVNILTQVYPVGNHVLPQGVKLNITDELGENILEVISRDEDNWIQLEFSAELGEKFQIMVAYGESQQAKIFEV